jgi:hypothetical protein
VCVAPCLRPLRCSHAPRPPRPQYEVFFGAHHWFIVFFVFLLAHGPVFFAWSILPLVLYIAERYLRIFRGNK